MRMQVLDFVRLNKIDPKEPSNKEIQKLQKMKTKIERNRHMSGKGPQLLNHHFDQMLEKYANGKFKSSASILDKTG